MLEDALYFFQRLCLSFKSDKMSVWLNARAPYSDKNNLLKQIIEEQIRMDARNKKNTAYFRPT